jgi:DNA-binding CsgD family transcriptional regulator/PAS domain-containing protein
MLILDLVYETIDQPDLWVDVLTRLVERFRLEASGFYTQNTHQTDGRMVDSDLAVLEGYDPLMVDGYWEHFYRLNPFLSPDASLPVGAVFTDAVNPNWRRGEFYEDWCRQQHFDHAAAQFLQREANGATSIAVLWRSSQAGAFVPDETVALSAIMHHANRALTLRSRLLESELRLGALDGMADVGGAGFVSLGRDGRVREADDNARRLLDATPDLSFRAGRLRLPGPAEQTQLDAMIAQALAQPLRAGGAPASLTVSRGGGRRPLILTLFTTLPGRRSFAADGGTSAVLRLEEQGEAMPAFGERLRRLFGLTPAEVRLAEALQTGGSLREVADQLGIAYETARSQLKMVFQKTGTRRQKDLALRLTGR